MNETHIEWQNVWLGVSVEDQRRADERIPMLLRTPARVRFLSCEPLLGPIDLNGYLADHEWLHGVPGGINWVIVGGESGPGARPMDLEWARNIVQQCKAAGVPVFVKQLGSYWARGNAALAQCAAAMHGLDHQEMYKRYGKRLDPGYKGGNPDFWPEDLRIREIPL